MAKVSITTDELILKVVETADAHGVVDKPYSGAYGRLLKDRVRYKADPIGFIVSRAKELTGRDITIYTQENQLDLYKFQLQSMGLIKNVDGVESVDARVLLGETKVDGVSDADLLKYRALYRKLIEYSKSHKISIDDVFSKMGIKYLRMRGPSNSTVTEEEIISTIASFADKNGNVDALKKDRKTIHKIRDWLRDHDYQNKNEDVVAILSDFMIERCPQYYFTKTLVKIEDTIHTHIYKKLKEFYGKDSNGNPKKPPYIIQNLKMEHRDIYYTLSRIKREMPYGSNISMKEFIETMYTDFIYDSEILVSHSKLNEGAVLAELQELYGRPDKLAPVSKKPLITDLSRDCRIYSNVYKLACNNMMTVKEYLESVGYQYVDLKQKFDSIKNHLIYMQTDELYGLLGKDIPENMARHFIEIKQKPKTNQVATPID